MKKVLALLLTLIILCSPLTLHTAKAVEPSQISSRTAVLMDAATGQVIYDKGMHHQVFPASTTKILTALVVLENSHPDEVMVASATALDLPWYGASIGLVPGEMLTVEDALFAIMLPSANDASNVLAEHVAGSMEAFAQMMTARAHELGAVNSNFTNAHGLQETNHFTTAYDMALITRAAWHNPEFMRYFGAPTHEMPPTNLNEKRQFTNFQRMLIPEFAQHDPRVTGGKTGFTNAARHTMSTTATRGDRSLVSVVMYSVAREGIFEDTARLLDFGFNEFIPLTVEGGRFGDGQLPILSGGTEIGRAYFPVAGDFTALVHFSADPNLLQISRDSRDFYDYLFPSPYTVSFELPTTLPFVPTFLGSVTIQPDLDIAVAAAMSTTSGGSDSFWSGSGGLMSTLMTVGIVFASIAVFSGVFILHRRARSRKLYRQRMARMERRRRTEYSEFIPATRQDAGRVGQSEYYMRGSGYQSRRAR